MASGPADQSQPTESPEVASEPSIPANGDADASMEPVSGSTVNPKARSLSSEEHDEPDQLPVNPPPDDVTVEDPNMTGSSDSASSYGPFATCSIKKWTCCFVQAAKYEGTGLLGHDEGSCS